MYKNNSEQQVLSLNYPVRSTHRSDGTVKIYGHNLNGELMTVVMEPKESDTGYGIVEVKLAGKITYRKL